VVVEFAENDLVMSALGGCVGYLDICQIAKQVISQKSFTKYDPINTNSTTMVIDSRGLATLEIFRTPFFFTLLND
jgi:xanthine dehydrogenase iron-sulfur cluster and FAD-binding subunit A